MGASGPMSGTDKENGPVAGMKPQQARSDPLPCSSSFYRVPFCIRNAATDVIELAAGLSSFDPLKP